MTTPCPICASPNAKSFCTLPGITTFLFPVPAEMAQRIERRELTLSACRNCGHIFQPAFDDALLKTIYEEYYAHYPFSTAPATDDVYRQPLLDIFALLTRGDTLRKARRLLEIGCSSPANLKPFLDAGFHCTGIDPSPLAQTDEDHDRMEILSGYFEETTFPAKFDVIVSRFVLEHVTSLDHHLKRVKYALSPDGLVVIQVPNISYYLESRQPFFAAHEHIQYFSLRSLTTLFARHGFEVVLFHEAGQPSIIACFKPERRTISCVGRNMHDELGAHQATIDRTRHAIASLVEGSRPKIFYGCGLLLWWVLHEMSDKISGPVTIIDDNEQLKGLQLPAFDLPVQSYSPELLANDPTVFLTLNPMYHRRVRQRLSKQKRPMRVVAIGPDGVHETHES